MDRFSIGIDPGFGEAAAVLYRDADENAVLAYATYTAPDPKDPPAARAMALADRVIDTLAFWVDQFDIKLLDIGIETPVMAKNVDGFSKQWRFVQELESGIMHRLSGELIECWVTEVNPSTSKSLATNDGRASKAEMIEASPFRASGFRDSTKEALADAWAHGLATWETKGSRFNFTAAKAATTRQII